MVLFLVNKEKNQKNNFRLSKGPPALREADGYRYMRGRIVMKKRILLLAFCVLLTACGAPRDSAEELIVFAAASMQEALVEIGGDYTVSHPEISVVFNFDSSGALQTQIEEGAPCDIFISAGQKQMDGLESGNFLLPHSRFDLLENKAVLAVPEHNPARINSYTDLKAALEAGSILFAMGNSDVPVGQYTQKILAYLDLDEAGLAASGVITYGSNVKEVAAQIAEGLVDCGVIYATDACSARLTVVDAATEEMCGQVVYPAAILAASKRPAGAQDFLDFLQTEGKPVLERVGFTPIGA